MQIEKYLYCHLIAGVALAGSISACVPGGESSGPPAAKVEPPAKVGKISVETTLTTVKLSENAYARLGIATVAVAETTLERTKVYGGTVVVPPGGSASIIAPVTGTLVPVDPAESPGISIGSLVKAGDNLLRFLPLNASQDAPLSTVERGQLMVATVTVERAQLDAVARVEAAQVKASAATTALKRAEQLLRDKVGSQRSVDEARSALELAQNELAAATAQMNAIKDDSASSRDSGSAPLDLLAPISGTVQNIHAVPGQMILAGQSLLDISGMDTLWVRVPVFATEISDVKASQHAVIRPLGRKEQELSFTGKPVQGLPLVPTVLSTMDLYFEFSPTESVFTPGQRVEVRVSMKDSSESILAVPTSAILYDVLGGAWVYTEVEPMTFERSRVEVMYFMENQAILARGPLPGVLVVTDGAAELFGTEFGNDKK